MPPFVPAWPLAAVLSAAPGSAPAAEPTTPEEREAKPVIVVSVHGEVDDLLADALRAIQAHTQGGPVELVVERSDLAGSDMRGQMRQAKALADEHRASGVFWLDLQNEDEFLLYLFEPEGLRVLVRRIPTSAHDRAAAIESLGVIVGSSSEAIAAGETVGMTPVDTEATTAGTQEAESVPPDPAPVLTGAEPSPLPRPPPPPTRAWRLLRVSLAYAGTSYASNMRWQQGASVALSVAAAPRLYAGIDYTLLAPDSVVRPVPLRLWRHPIALHFGFHQVLVPWLALDAELSAGVTLDRWNRSDTQDTGLRVVGMIAPWLYLRFSVWRSLSLDVGVGAEVTLNDFDYVWTCEMSNCVVVDPDRFRGRVRGGLSYSF